MKFLEELWDAIKGNTVARVKDPIIGTFVISWLVCNWYEISLLFFGNGKSWERLDRLHLYLGTNISNNYMLVIFIPIIITVFYLFLFPKMSFYVKKWQKNTNNNLFEQAFETEKLKAEKQIEINKEKLKSDPDKTFLSELVNIDIEKKKADIELQSQRIEKIKLDNAILKEKERILKIEAKDKELKAISAQNAYNLEKEKYEIMSMRNKSIIARERFPIAYYFLVFLSKNCEEYGYILPFNMYGEIIANLFKYNDFSSLLNDENFNNETISQVKYLYLDYKDLSGSLMEIIEDNIIDNKKINDDELFEIISSMLEQFEIKIIDDKIVEDIASETFDNEKYNLIHRVDISGILVDHNINDPDFYFDDILNITLSNDKLTVKINVTINGSHQPGENVNIDIYSPVLVGGNALGEFEIEEPLRDY